MTEKILKEILYEVKAMRSDLSKHTIVQQIVMKSWRKEDVKNHYEKDKKVSKLLENILSLLNKKAVKHEMPDMQP